MSSKNIFRKIVIAAVGTMAALGGMTASATATEQVVADIVVEPSSTQAFPVFLCLVNDFDIFFVFSRAECDALGGEFLG